MKELFSEGGESERSSDGLSNSEVLVNVTREGDLLGLPSHFVGSEGSMISEVREEGEGGALDGSGVNVSLQSEIVSHL